MPPRQPLPSLSVIHEVNETNLEVEFNLLRRAIVTHTFVALDVEYPGVIIRSLSKLSMDGGVDATYEMIKINVNCMTPIQIGIVLTDKDGMFPTIHNEIIAGWNFNMSFSTKKDVYSMLSLEILQDAGIRFAEHRDHGIEPAHFGELIISSGLVLDEDVTWITCHSAYSIAYLLKLVTGRPIPSTLDAFYDTVRIWLPNLWDLRYAVTKFKNTSAGRWVGGLEGMAKELGTSRDAGTKPHIAAHDALLVSSVFHALITRYVPDSSTNLATLGPGASRILYGLKPNESISNSHHNLSRTSSASAMGGGGNDGDRLIKRYTAQ
jgi:CCR4-NOT transcription complex subunit 7/8